VSQPLASQSPYDLRRRLDDELAQAASDGLGAHVEDAAVRVSPPDQEGDFQSTLALRLAPELKRDPGELATRLADLMSQSELCDQPTVSGKGFVNFHVSSPLLASAVSAIAADQRLLVAPAKPRQRVVLDYGSPNVAKEMHVGHLRSTIIGDSLRRLLEHYGHDVIPQNHLGDWGTPFGMLVEHMIEESSAGRDSAVTDLTRFYQAARQQFESDEAFAERARQRVVRLQQGDEESLRVWRELRGVSEHYFQGIYDRLGVGLREADNVGESFYNPMLESVVDELSERGLLSESDGALCMFPPGFTARDGSPMPIIVRKRDGGFNYDTTDLAAIRYRLRELGADCILYVVGAPQGLHFEMLFAAAALAGWTHPDTDLRHVAFGSVLGEDGKMLRTRAGKTVKLTDLLDEAVARAGGLLDERALGSADRDSLGEALGIGAIKYADLSSDRVRDYTFAFDRMLSFEGNTAAYLQYAHARVCSLLRRYGQDPERVHCEVLLGTSEERSLALQLAGFGTELAAATELLQPYKLCIYLHELAARFSKFYEACPIGGSEEGLMASRLLLAETVGRTIRVGLDLLGIEAPERL